MANLKKMSNKVKTLLLGAVAVGSSAFAADGITYNKATGTFSGAIDLGAYYSGVEIAVAVVGVTLGVSLFFAMLKRAKS
jgi:hypothetical protein